ncbi:hypothetical protein FGO68_gene9703 [Halteria grandinella]|uniref:NADP-dependent oxidoreductase domain-containing protein n=1 Tax=Halteria grandinella TaxID=5974 RepID=A0A8J8SW05_HALGN|nr:hypothetical protein FGO68_gene9703 [Halteria grandinella]
MPTFIRSHGASIPAIGLGTWMLTGDACTDAVASAIGAGYRHIDTAIGYGNETEVGEGIRRSGIARDSLFVTTKIPPEQLAADDMMRAAEGSLKRLGVDQVDLLLIHWPSKSLSATETIRSLNAVKERGLTRHIGVSNYTIRLLDEAWAATSAPIVANQCEHHPYLDQPALRAATAAHGTAFVSYCPLGQAEVLENEIVARQRGFKWHPGDNVHSGKDHTLHSSIEGVLGWSKDQYTTKKRTYIHVIPQEIPNRKFPTPPPFVYHPELFPELAEHNPLPFNFAIPKNRYRRATNPSPLKARVVARGQEQRVEVTTMTPELLKYHGKAVHEGYEKAVLENFQWDLNDKFKRHFSSSR